MPQTTKTASNHLLLVKFPLGLHWRGSALYILYTWSVTFTVRDPNYPGPLWSPRGQRSFVPIQPGSWDIPDLFSPGYVMSRAPQAHLSKRIPGPVESWASTALQRQEGFRTSIVRGLDGPGTRMSRTLPNV